MTRAFRLSKSKIIAGLQCPKRLWLEMRRPELIEYSAQTEAVFASGNRVGEVARNLRSGGILIESQGNLSQALRDTGEALAGGADATLFEATFRHRDVLVRADVLERRDGVFHLIEVKSSTSVKEYHLRDAAVQAWVIAGDGRALGSVAIAHIDSSFVYPGGGDYHGLFNEVAVTEQIGDLVAQVPGWVTGFQMMLANPLPAIATGPQCNKPFACPFFSWCSSQEVEAGGLFAAAAAGPPPEQSSPADCLDHGAQTLIAALGWPRRYLDFETIGFAVPVWAGTRPYEQLPFQWSCHAEDAAGAVAHTEFLDLSGDPPMRACAASLLSALGDEGPIMTYTKYERTVLRALAARFPDLSGPLEAISARLVDLYQITRAHYRLPDPGGSYSLKAILKPIAPELDYAALDEVHDGVMAQAAYLEATGRDGAGEPVSEERRDVLRRALLAYCAQDTMAMVRLAHFLGGDEDHRLA
jgi:hypothetical protein